MPKIPAPPVWIQKKRIDRFITLKQLANRWKGLQDDDRESVICDLVQNLKLRAYEWVSIFDNEDGSYFCIATEYRPYVSWPRAFEDTYVESEDTASWRKKMTEYYYKEFPSQRVMANHYCTRPYGLIFDINDMALFT